MRYWSVHCDEARWPGLWRLWEERQVATVGWPPSARFRFDGSGRRSKGWTTVRNALGRMEPGHRILARLPKHRIGRVGEILRLHVTDTEWKPLVPEPGDPKGGEQGRLIVVRWDFGVGPQQREFACALPERARLTMGQLRQTVTELDHGHFSAIERSLGDSRTWVPAFAHHFQREAALSDYIAAHPERLEPGLRPKQFVRVREKQFQEAGLVDVLLEDAAGQPVVVECKQGGARPEHVAQLRRYMRAVRKDMDLDRMPRGILVVDGAPALSPAMRRLVREAPRIDVYAHRLDVVFTPVT